MAGGLFFAKVLCHIDPMHCPGHIWPFSKCDPPLEPRFRLDRPPRVWVSREQFEYWMAQRAALMEEFDNADAR